MGGVAGATAKHLGLVGAVTDGVVRDVDEYKQYGLPVYARGIAQQSVRGRSSCAGYGIEVRLDGVRVRPGDYIFADMNGTVVIPMERVAEVLAFALEGEGHRGARDRRDPRGRRPDRGPREGQLRQHAEGAAAGVSARVQQRRAMLFVGGLVLEGLGATLASGRGPRCVDLEDAVPPGRKDEARAAALKARGRVHHPRGRAAPRARERDVGARGAARPARDPARRRALRRRDAAEGERVPEEVRDGSQSSPTRRAVPCDL